MKCTVFIFHRDSLRQLLSLSIRDEEGCLSISLDRYIKVASKVLGHKYSTEVRPLFQSNFNTLVTSINRHNLVSLSRLFQRLFFGMDSPPE